MEKLNELEKVVSAILKENPTARGDDDLLYVLTLEKKGINLNDHVAKWFILNYRKQGIPTIESVGRCRRRLQERNEALKPTPDIQLKRKKLENSFYHYSLGMKA